jgi:dihydrolipoamide dehydrogenase
MASEESYDLAVLGAGPGGYVAAIRGAQLGLRTALIEKRPALGGTCLNVGCIPSKALLESSELYAEIQRGLTGHGINVQKATLDLPAMMRRKSGIVRELTDGLDLLMKKNKIRVYRGHGRLTGPHALRVEGEPGPAEIEARQTILACGSAPVELPSLPFDGERVVSSTEALSFDAVPSHLLVVGAGAVGLELGSVWSRLGARVTVVELLPRIVPFADEELSKALHRALSKQGLEIKLECRVDGAERTSDGVRVKILDSQGGTDELEVSHVLVAVGRRPVTQDIGLEQLGIQTERGKVVVDRHYRTQVASVMAIGDLIEGPMLAHKAEDEGMAAAEIAAGKPGHVNYDAIPNVVYTWPELASVGLSEQDAKEQGMAVRIGRYRFAANGRAKTLGASEGLVKLVAHAETDRLLGAHIVGARASDMIAELVLGMEFSASAEDIARTSHAHPTLSEIVKEAALAVDRRPIHG